MRDYIIFKKTPIQVAERSTTAPEGEAIDARPGTIVETWVPVLDPAGQPAIYPAESENEAIDHFTHDGDGKLIHPGSYHAVSKRNWGRSVTLRAKVETDRSYGDD